MRRVDPTIEDISKKGKRRDVVFITLMVLPAVILVIWQMYYPVIAGLRLAFTNYNIQNINRVRYVGFKNFIDLFKPGPFNDFYRTMWNSLVFVLGALIPQLIIGFALALMLNRAFRGRSIYQGVAFAPWAVSGFVIGIMWRWMFNGMGGVINDLLVKAGILKEPFGWLSSSSTALFCVIVAMVWYGIPFFTIMITAALQSVPQELYEAAEMDGAGRIAKFKAVTLPHIKSVIILTTLLRVIWIFTGSDTIISMTGGGPAGSTQILTSKIYYQLMDGSYGKASATSIVCTLIMVLYTLFYLKITKFAEDD